VTELDQLRAHQEALETTTEALQGAFRRAYGSAGMTVDLARQIIKLITTLRATQLEHGQVIAALAADVAELKEGLAEVLRRLPA
jgi:ABC-type transporter Mla subunit MlaD